MKWINLISSVICLVILCAGCAHYHKVEGREEKSEIPAGIRVAIGSPEVHEGDKVDIYKIKCVKRKMHIHAQSNESCSHVTIGQALVLKVLTRDTAIVKPEGDVTLEPNLYVEKSKN